MGVLRTICDVWMECAERLMEFTFWVVLPLLIVAMLLLGGLALGLAAWPLVVS